MTAVGMVAFFISVWLNNALGSIGGSMMLLFTMLIIGAIPYFKPIQDYLFTSHLFVGSEGVPRPDTLERYPDFYGVPGNLHSGPLHRIYADSSQKGYPELRLARLLHT